MKLFLDTANINEINDMKEIIDGVTTNPSLVSKEKENFIDILHKITTLVDGPISAEVISPHEDGMIKEARELALISPKIVVKLPLTEEGIKATFRLSQENIKTNLTLCFSANQAILAAKAHATYVSPFIGRLDDLSYDGMLLIKDIVQIYSNYGYKTKIIAASIRHPLHVIEAAKAKAHIATIPYKLLKMLFKHPLTDKGIDTFLKDWKKKQINQNKTI